MFRVLWTVFYAASVFTSGVLGSKVMLGAGAGYGGVSRASSYRQINFAPTSSSSYGAKSSTGAQVIQAAIQSRHNIQFYDVPTTGTVKPTVVEVGANSIPLQILFRSSSSSLNVHQQHEGATGTVQESSSEDEPHHLIHNVKKPIIQEVHEVITPYRKITQQIHPVQEEIQTIVARGSLDDGYGGDGGSLYGDAVNHKLTTNTATATLTGINAFSENFKLTDLTKADNYSQVKKSY